MKRRTLLILSAAMAGLAMAPAAWGQDDSKSFKPEELDQMLAPIALYPDSLLSQVLMAASYPLEIVEAARWSKANPNLKGDAALAAVKDKGWDTSVKSLVAFPSVLIQLNDHLDWTQKLGDAMISQEQAVADSIQRLRARSADAGNLKSGPQQTVEKQGSGTDQTIVIQPASTDTVYVPAYDPSWAYGSWPDAGYPPTYYPPPAGYGYGAALASGILWGVGIAATAALFTNWNWGRGNSYVNVNVNRAVNIDNHFDRNRYANNGRWQHNAEHRRGVAYRDAATRQHFGQHRPNADQRQQFRGQLASHSQPGNHPNVHPHAGAQHPNLQQRAGGQHPNVQNRAGNHPNLQQHQVQQNHAQNRGNFAGGARPSALNGTNRGHQVNREAARGRAQHARATSHPSYHGGGGRGHRR